MKGFTKFGLVNVLTLVGLILVSIQMVQCYTILGVEIPNIFSGPSTSDDAAALSPAGLAPAPAPGPSMSRRYGPISFTPGLVVGFYDDKCNFDVEEFIEFLVEEEYGEDPTILPALLRLQFHDCFVHGCDASILIDGESTEKTSDSNLSVRGYEVIERIKAALEKECPGVVSCADIIVVATKVVIKLRGGLNYPVETGRRDGLVSNVDDVKLPSPSMTVSEGAAVFTAKNFTVEEMVVLLGYHAVGSAHCKFIQPRIYKDSDQYDPDMDETLRRKLRKTCPQRGLLVADNSALLNQDPSNNNTLNNGFYDQLIVNRGILHLDQLLSRDPETADIVAKLAQNRTWFNIRSVEVMIKLQAVEVLTGKQGEIRNKCNRFN